jgi:hypothetical protein
MALSEEALTRLVDLLIYNDLSLLNGVPLSELTTIRLKCWVIEKQAQETDMTGSSTFSEEDLLEIHNNSTEIVERIKNL